MMSVEFFLKLFHARLDLRIESHKNWYRAQVLEEWGTCEGACDAR